MGAGIKLVHNGFRASRVLTRKLFYLQYDYFAKKEYDAIWNDIADGQRFSSEEVKRYKNRWKWSHANIIPTNLYKVCATISGKRSADFLPDNVYNHSIEPVINNKQVSHAYADKALYDRLLGSHKKLLPVTLLKNVNGIFFDGLGNQVADPEKQIQSFITNEEKLLVKPSIDSWGGRDVYVFYKNNGRFTLKNKDTELTLKWLLRKFEKDFVIQQVLKQHPFYRQFNESSFNTFRVFTYRSVADNKLHLLHVALRIGKPDSEVDNIKMGGTAIVVKPSGELNDFALLKTMRKIEHVPNKPELKLKELGKLHKIDEIKATALELAEYVPHSRLIGFDMSIDEDDNIRLVEINTSNIGIGAQIMIGPFFGEFTQEVIDYCKKMKKVDILKIY
ncbi:hypothetical protein KDU71_18125 [Carboxylicivirga sediminis]|uniref:Alpha-L-glutamate ligase-related protein ATP-grasp domain-containing protein n=1 Tax=Carboxylicivirga sediminis TaxID=2006564 RepID=A0A941J0N8_9BACT|nr:sugar-transfer associated ATP-grasp domain-containing protein [Carboxylicivirga sediminis]MBR8537492.1 hypothetical protein [Carboxylicivirga sediminis]